MPLFNEASRIYSPNEVNFLRSCFSQSAIILEESDRSYSAEELAGCIIRLYESGLRDLNSIAELAARLAHSKFTARHDELEAHLTSLSMPG
ncbi:hypothetical protein DKP76_16425 [Falsochrobactrum shanghaiense]|uniref:Uncharacterized protein n=2 Tax=Falsochrobactrum shanghaiense TaxID=2201899 RepID=A0A316J796_9HYPH|nr:hypothetical protein DKP76_16425 [Falsochrobactrum shanghaiense]